MKYYLPIWTRALSQNVCAKYELACVGKILTFKISQISLGNVNSSVSNINYINTYAIGKDFPLNIFINAETLAALAIMQLILYTKCILICLIHES